MRKEDKLKKDPPWDQMFATIVKNVTDSLTNDNNQSSNNK